MGRSATPKLSVLLSVAGAGLYPMLCFGLGLSEIQLDSRLNQPLRARIEVLDVSDEEWTLVHGRLNRQSAPDTAALRPELLGSMTVRTIQDAQHRHFVEIGSTEPLAEPLFDLPVEVAGPTGHVIRNYAVLLDPPAPGDDTAGGTDSKLAERSASANEFASADGAATDAATTGVTSAGGPVVASGSTAAPAQLNTTRRPSNSTRGARHRHAAHSSRRARPADASGAAGENGAQATAGAVADRLGATTSHGAAPTFVASNTAAQQELLNQLELLQKTLTRMQQTISAQNAQIAHLTAKVARAESQASHSTTTIDSPRAASPSGSSSAATTDVDTGDADGADDGDAAPRPYFWLTVLLGATTLVAIVSAVFIQWRAKRAARKLAPNQGASAQQEWSAERRPSTERQVSTSNGAEYQGSSARRAGTVGSLTTPAAQQKQMEADGRVQIDWDKDLWNKPEWARLFGEQPGATEQPTGEGPMVDVQGAGAHGADLDSTNPQPVAHIDAVPDSHFADLPEVSTAKLTEATHANDVDLTHLTDLASLIEPDHAPPTDADVTTILTESEVEQLTKLDAVPLSEANTSKLSEANGTSNSSEDDTEVLDQQAMPNARRLRRRRAGRR